MHHAGQGNGQFDREKYHEYGRHDRPQTEA